MPNPNGEVKKFRPQTAVIRIVEQPNGKFNASLQFEPSIRPKKKKKQALGQIEVFKPGAEDNIAVRVAWFVWSKLREAQKSHIVITDE